jgi:hypothetical protein
MYLIKNILMNKRLAILILFAFAFIMPIFATPPPPPPPPPDNGGPIEGGLIYLLAMGIGYGINKIKSLKKEIAI